MIFHPLPDPGDGVFVGLGKIDHQNRSVEGAGVSEGQYAGAMPRAICRLPVYHPDYSDSFNRRATEVRIDYVQHAMSAMIAFDQLGSAPRATALQGLADDAR